MMAPGPARVAIIGGGCAALTTAFELTRPEHRGRYEVTVYQMGFRLGGKGASGRGVEGRIEEHGLHLWMGFYENAFRLMRAAYREAGRDPARCPVATFDQAFAPAPVVAVTDRVAGGDFHHWIADFPPGKGQPGEALSSENPFTVAGYLQQSAILVVELLRSAAKSRPEGDAPAGAAASPLEAEDVIAGAERLLRYAELATTAAIVEAAELLRGAIGAVFPPVYHEGRKGVVLRLLDALSAAARRQLEVFVGGDAELARVWVVVDLILAILRGSIRFGLAVDPRGFDAIDDYDWRDWLALNGASPRSLESGFMRGIYDLAFAFEDGDVSRPRLAAGVALRGAMRMFFTYRGSLFWRMSAGMGDIVFAPLYEVLHRRGVRFEFFHRLENIALSPPVPGDRPHVAALELAVQAEIQGGGEYRPLVDVNGLPCWPAEPDYAQLVDGARLAREAWAFESPWEPRAAGKKTLRVTEDFDFVVLGLGAGAIPGVAGEIIAREPRWRVMTEQVKTVATQAFQVWLREGVAELGWKAPPVNLSGFVEPFDTWADMTHLVPAERWRVPPRNISYFCSVLPDPVVSGGARDEAFAAQEYARVREHAVRFLDRDVGALWPLAVKPTGGFRWELLCDDESAGKGRRRRPKAEGEARFDTQFWTANVRPSDRYVLSLPGTIKHRLSPLDLTVDNLTVAGDWTQSGLNTGCVESAVMSGLLAAHAVSGSPPLEDIIGYDHP